MAVPAQRTGDPAAPPVAPPGAVPPPPTPPPAVPPQKAPQFAVPSEDPGATGRNDGSRTPAPLAPPVAPRGGDPADRPPGEGRASDDGRGPGHEERRGHDAGGAAGTTAGTGDGPAAHSDGGPAGRLLGEAESDRLGQRLHHALAGFVDSPHESVEEAAEVLAAAEKLLVASLRDRRAALRAGWQENGDPDGPGPDTEQLRLTLRTYREVTERLLRA
ncbi:hypothetical protein [Streptomyces sp. NBC_00691]|uniref:hypothetical protein n=1 Tax=Streptomyces sp. NBC_00691 TaxID=2903671 RepID=UPI002E368DE2|nr:hypothetical protein [Streptomyces sp. NBC_00691]